MASASAARPFRVLATAAPALPPAMAVLTFNMFSSSCMFTRWLLTACQMYAKVLRRLFGGLSWILSIFVASHGHRLNFS